MKRTRRALLIAGGVLALAIYVVWAMWGVYGGYYLGYPPYTPAYLNNTNRPIVRELNLPRSRLLWVSGLAGEGRIVLFLDGKPRATFTGRFDERLVVGSGHHELRIEPQGASGNVNYGFR